MSSQENLYLKMFLEKDKLLLMILLLSAFLLLAIIVSMMVIYKKSGKPAISVIIPIWSQIVLFQIVSIPWWCALIPGVNIIMLIPAYIKLSTKFGKKSIFALGIICLPMIFIPLLSFSDCNDEVKQENEIEQTIYNPFNETNIEQIMPEAPMNLNINEVLENDSREELVQTEIPVIENSQYNNFNNAVVEPVVEESINNLVNQEPVVDEHINNLDNQEPVIEEIPVMPINTNVNETAEEHIGELEIPVINDFNDNNNINNINGVENILNPTIQDIEEALNINKDINQVAFNSTPIIEDNKNNENTNSEEIVNEEIIEMPEFASKTCPACGVAVSDNINFCTSCGTKL